MSTNPTWRDIPHVSVRGNSDAESLDVDPEMKTWMLYAVMKVSHPVPFYPLFFNDVCPTPQFSPDGLVYGTRYFAMRIGPDDVKFGVLPAGDTLVPCRGRFLEVELVRITELGSLEFEMFEEINGEIELR